MIPEQGLDSVRRLMFFREMLMRIVMSGPDLANTVMARSVGRSRQFCPEFIVWRWLTGPSRFVKPGKPMQNGFIQRFDRSYRKEMLNMFVFDPLNQVREQTEMWLKEYDEERPRESLGDLTPREFPLTQNPFWRFASS